MVKTREFYYCQIKGDKIESARACLCATQCAHVSAYPLEVSKQLWCLCGFIVSCKRTGDRLHCFLS